MTYPTHVRSGGQTGADVSALLAAKTCGLKTGGVMPLGWVTLDGPKPYYAELFGMTQHATSRQYPPRTEANVRDSDGTIRLALDFTTAGERLTKRLVDQYKRPDFKVDLNDPPSYMSVVDWLAGKKIATLNVAGNSHKTDPSMGIRVFNYLVNVFAYTSGSFDVELAEQIRERFRTGIYKH